MTALKTLPLLLLCILLLIPLVSITHADETPTPTPGVCYAEKYWYEDHFDNAGTFGDWVDGGTGGDMSNWYIDIGNSTLESNSDSPTYGILMNKEKFGYGNYSFLYRADSRELVLGYGDFGSIFDAFDIYLQYIEPYWEFTPSFYHFRVDTPSDQPSINENLMPPSEWNWYNMTYIEESGQSHILFYINNTLQADETDPSLFDPGYIFTFTPDPSKSTLIQFDYISFSNLTEVECPGPTIPERPAQISHPVFVALLALIFGLFVYIFVDNKNRFYGDIVAGAVGAVLAFYLALAVVNGGVYDILPVLYSSNHTVINGTVAGAVNLTTITSFLNTYNVIYMTWISSGLSFLLFMLGLAFTIITGLNVMDVFIERIETEV